MLGVASVVSLDRFLDWGSAHLTEMEWSTSRFPPTKAHHDFIATGSCPFAFVPLLILNVPFEMALSVKSQHASADRLYKLHDPFRWRKDRDPSAGETKGS